MATFAPFSARRRAGFSLVELAAALAIAGIAAGLVLGALGRLKQAAQYRDTVDDFVSATRQLRAQALAQAVPTVLVVDPAAGTWVAFADRDSNFTLTGFSVAAQVPAPDVLLARGKLPASMAIAMPLVGASPANLALPRPYSWVPAGTNACTFCDPLLGLGALVFQPNGVVSLPAAAGAMGGSVTLTDRKSQRHATVAVVARTGAVTAFEDL